MQGMLLTLVLFVGPLVMMTGGGMLFARLTRGLVKPGHGCKQCGHDLRSLGGAGRCPECGSTDGAVLGGSARWIDVVAVCLLATLLCGVAMAVTGGLDPDYWWLILLLGPLLVVPGMITFAFVAFVRVSERALPRGVVWVWGLASGAGCVIMPPIAEFVLEQSGSTDGQEAFSMVAVPFMVHYVSVPCGLVGLAIARRFTRRA